MNQKVFENRIMRIFSKSYYLIPSDAELYNEIITKMIKPFKNLKFDKVVGLDTRGFFYGPAIANNLKKGFVPIFKKGKIEDINKVICGQSYIDHSGLKKSLEILKESIKKNEKILIVDDWFETGNTGKSVINLIESLGGIVVGISIIFNEMKKIDEEFFNQYNLHFLIRREPKESPSNMSYNSC